MGAFDKLWLYKLVILKAAMYSVLTLISAFLTGVANCDFPFLSAWNKFLIYLGVMSSWLITMMAFVEKGIAKIESDIASQAPPPPGVQIHKETTTTETVKVDKPAESVTLDPLKP
jgi:hypothetical protein